MLKTILEQKCTRRELPRDLARQGVKVFAFLALAEETVRNLAACAVISYGRTKPNTINTEYPGYQHLAANNLLLANEIGKLPEIQDGVSESELYALEHIVGIHKEIPKDFDDTFERMYQVGKPDVRKYCSPLQAVFWIFESERADDARGILKHYSLDELLHTAWPSKKSVLTEYQTLDIIDGMKNKKERKEYQEWYSRIGNSKKLWAHLLTEYLVEPEKFSEKGQRMLATLMKPPKPLKEEEWEDFNTVVERLNAPKLIHYYTSHAFTFYFAGFVPKETPASAIFYNKKGACYEYALFIEFCLDKAGYKAHIYNIPHLPHKIVGCFDVDNKWYKIDRKGISGPFETEREFMKTFSCVRFY